MKLLDNDVNEAIRKEQPVSMKEVPLNEAYEISGVRAMFSEAYPNPVRVVAVGVDLDEVLKVRFLYSFIDLMLIPLSF